MSSFQRWKRRMLFLFCIGAVFGCGFVGLHYSAQHVPEFYIDALEDSNLTRESAEQFRGRTELLLERIETDPDWRESFTEQQINSWLAYELPELEVDLIPQEVSNPRVCLEDGYCLAACRYDSEDFSGVLSLKIRPKITESEELALELVSVKAGLIPIPLERVFDELNNDADLLDLSFDLVEVDERKVLLISSERSSDSVPNLKSVAIEDKQIIISGKGRPEAAARLTQRPSAPSTAPELAN